VSSSGRLLEILQILRSSRRPVTARAMAKLLEVTQRTIYRDIVTLQGLRIPVEGTAGIGYVLGARCALPPLNFSSDEIDAIVVGLSLLDCTGDRALRVAASQVVRKIAAVLPDTAAADIESMPLRVWPWDAIPASLIDVSIVRRAIRDEQKLEVQYTDAESRCTARTVRPIALIYYVESIVLAAWCELRQDFRHFRVDRLNACHPSAVRFRGEGCRLRAQWQSVHWPISNRFQRASAL
jgi:predicted DNA-binding transcriptional regulator YafY